MSETEQKSTESQVKKITTTNSNAEKSSLKINNFFKIIVILIIFFLGLFFYSYFIELSKRKFQARGEAEKFSNLDGDIFDLDQDFKDDYIPEHDFKDLSVNELKEKNAEFIYKLLIKNQVQIEQLSAQNRELKNEFIKYKNSEKLNKMVISYLNFRDQLLMGKDFEREFASLELSSVFDEVMKVKLKNLKTNLNLFLTNEKLSNNFKKLIPDLVTLRQDNPDRSQWFNKLNQKIAKIIVIRRTVSNNLDDIDDKIITIEDHLQMQNYQEALNVILSMDQSYNAILKNFLENLNASFEVQKIDQEIVNYLKSLN